MVLNQLLGGDSADAGEQEFTLENDRVLRIDVDGSVMIKQGEMIAYEGSISFTGKSSAEGGLSGFVKNQVTSEGTPIMEAEGTGRLYAASSAHKIHLIDLGKNDVLSIDGNHVLAFDSDIDYEIGTIDSLSGMQAGGMTNVFLKGPGQAALTTYAEPVVLDPPVNTDPDATVGWSGDCTPGTNVNKSLSDLVGQSSGETYQLEFTGEDGFVIVQPWEG